MQIRPPGLAQLYWGGHRLRSTVVLATVQAVPSPALACVPFDALRSLKIKIQYISYSISIFRHPRFLSLTYIILSARPPTTPRDQASCPTSQVISLPFFCVIPVFLLPYIQRYLTLLILRIQANFRRYRSPPALKWRHMSRISIIP